MCSPLAASVAQATARSSPPNAFRNDRVSKLFTTSQLRAEQIYGKIDRASRRQRAVAGLMFGNLEAQEVVNRGKSERII